MRDLGEGQGAVCLRSDAREDPRTTEHRSHQGQELIDVSYIGGQLDFVGEISPAGAALQKGRVRGKELRGAGEEGGDGLG